MKQQAKYTPPRVRGYEIHVQRVPNGPVETLPLLWGRDVPEVWRELRDQSDVVYGKLIRSGRKFAEFNRGASSCK